MIKKNFYLLILYLINLFNIRAVNKDDLPQVLKIYNFHIKEGYGNFEEKKITISDYNALYLKAIKNKIPFLVAEQNKKIIGFSYLNHFRNKSGYRFSFENSIYVDKNFTGLGVGHKLLKSLITASKKSRKIKTIIAVIGGYKSQASIKIHKKNGFKMIGTLKKVGFKKGKWLDSIYMQKNFK